MKVLMIGGDPAALNPATPTGERTEEYRKIAGELEVLLCYGNLLRFTAAFFKGLKLMRKKKFDVITAQGPEHWFLAWIFSRFFKTPWQMQIHTDIFSPYFGRESFKNKIRVLIAKFLLPRADGLRVVSDRIKNSILGRLNLSGEVQPPNIDVLPIFVDAEAIRNAPVKINLHKKYPDHDFIILMASRLTREKNINLAIEALKEIIERKTLNPEPYTLNPTLLIVGEGSEKEKLQLKIENCGLENFVKMESWNDDLASYYKTADLFLITSNYEGYGRTPIEALAAGLPVVMTDVGLAGEIVKNGESGAVVPVGDKEKLAGVLAELMENSGLREKLKEGGRKAILNLSSKKEYLDAYQQCWSELVKK